MLFTFCRSAEDSATLQSLNCDGFSIEVSWEDVYLAKKVGLIFSRFLAF